MSLTKSEAKSIPLNIVVEEFGGRHSHTDRKGDEWYYSPFRPDERTASFKINPKLNTWHDFGMSQTFGHRVQGTGGDTIDLWCDYHGKDRRLGFAEALGALEKFRKFAQREEGARQEQRKEKRALQVHKPRYKILKASGKITSKGLLSEIDRRCVSRQLAETYLKQGYILDTVTKKTFYAFLFENDKQGYECIVPNPEHGSCFYTCIGSKASTRILSNNDEADSADVFEGVWDFLSWLEMRALFYPKNHSYILNSVSMVNEVCGKIKAFEETVKYVFLFMDNDEAGYQATHAIAEELEENFNVGGMEFLYDGYKDLSRFWIK